jgi:protein SCO1/2
MRRALALVAALAACPALADTAAAPASAPAGLPLPLNLGGAFTLTDQHGAPRTEADPQGHLQLLFFGYAACDSICAVALPQMAAIADGLAARGVDLTPVMVTVDPARDTPQAMAPALARIHPDFVGLTGPDTALSAVWRAFSIERSVVFEDPAGGAVYAHGSLLYLLDGQGRFLTVIPPILSDDRVIDIVAGYARGA